MMFRSKILFSLLVAFCLVVPLFGTVLSEPVDESSREDSRFLVWEDKKQITFMDRKEVAKDMDMDGDGNLHLVWINKTGSIFYGKLNETGDFLINEWKIGSSDRGWDSNVSLDVDESDDVHITWSNNTGPLGAREFHYLKLDKNGKVMVSKAGSGGDDILGTPSGSVAFRYYNNSTPGAPQVGPLKVFIFDEDGNEIGNYSMQDHMMGFEQVGWVRKDNGDLIFAMLYDENTMVYNYFDWITHGGSGTTLVISIEMSHPRLTFDNNGDLHLFWIDGRVSSAHTHRALYHLEMEGGGTSFSEEIHIGLENHMYAKDFSPRNLFLADSKNNDELAIIVSGYFAGQGSGGGETPDFYAFFTFDTDGKVTEEFAPLMEYCSMPRGESIPALVQDPSNGYYLVWGERMCGQSASDIWEDLFFMKTKGDFFIDPAILEEDIILPDRIFPSEDFVINFTVRNLGTYETTDLLVNVTYSDDGSVVNIYPEKLGPNDAVTHEFLFNVEDPTNLTFFVDPVNNTDSNLTNNIVNITIYPSFRPDFLISEANISFSPLRPARGEQVEITAEVTNLGGMGAEVDVEFYDGINGTHIGTNRMFSDTFTNITSILWTPTTSGIHNIAVNVVNSTPYELEGTMDDNYANKTILVGSHTIPYALFTSPEHGSNVTIGDINITGKALDQDGDALEVFVRVDQSAWEPTVMEGDNGDHSWFITWNLSDLEEGTVEITARVIDDIHENFTTISVMLIPPPPPLIYEYYPKEDPVLDEGLSQNLSLSVEANINCLIQYRWYLNGELVEENGTPYDENSVMLKFGFEDAGLWVLEAKASCGKYKVGHTWNVTVLDVNRGPVISTPSPVDGFSLYEGDNITFSVGAHDIDGDDLIYSWTGMDVDQTTSVPSVTFQASSVGNYTMILNVSDGRGGYAEHTWTIHVLEKVVPPPPPPTDTTRDDPWWILIVIIGIVCFVVMLVVYVKYLRKDGPVTIEDEDDDADEETPPSRIG